jgi:hypothetical protein
MKTMILYIILDETKSMKIIFTSPGKTNVFKKNIDLWKKCVSNGRCTLFSIVI